MMSSNFVDYKFGFMKMKVTFYGQSCFLLEWEGDRFLFDPFITPNPQAASVNINAIEADYILISHGHQDHLADAVALAQQTGAQVITNFEVANWLSAKGVEKCIGLNHGSAIMPFGELTYTWATHSSSLPDGSYGGNPGGFLIKKASGMFYYSGDTGLHQEFKTLEMYGSIDLAILPIGGLFTMNAKEALKAAQWCGAQKVMGVHFDTFPPITIDHAETKALFVEAGIPLVLPAIGETINF